MRAVTFTGSLNAAQAQCRLYATQAAGFRASVAAIENDAEAAFVLAQGCGGSPSAAYANGKTMWVGLTDSGPGAAEAGTSRTRAWRWQTGSADWPAAAAANSSFITSSAGAALWSDGNPDNFENQDCVMASDAGFGLGPQLSDEDCSAAGT